MSTGRLIGAIVVIFILSVVFGSTIHAFLLHDDYAALPGVFRPSAQVQLWPIMAAYLAFAVASVWLYAHGVEDRPWFGQGVRFGIAVWLVLSVPSFLIEFATQPVPETLVWKQLAYEFVNKVVLGIVTAAIVRRA